MQQFAPSFLKHGAVNPLQFPKNGGMSNTFFPICQVIGIEIESFFLSSFIRLREKTFL